MPSRGVKPVVIAILPVAWIASGRLKGLAGFANLVRFQIGLLKLLSITLQYAHLEDLQAATSKCCREQVIPVSRNSHS